MSAHLVVLITTGSPEEGHRIARALVDERLAACVNVLSPVQSIYRWNDQLQEDREVLLMVKTTAKMLEPLLLRVKQLHSYELPEIIALEVVAGASDYLDWIDHQIQLPSRDSGRRIEAP